MAKVFKTKKSATVAAIIGVVLLFSGVAVAALSGDGEQLGCEPAGACTTTTRRTTTTTSSTTTTTRPTTTTSQPTTTTTRPTTTTSQVTTTTQGTTTTSEGTTTTSEGTTTTSEGTTTTSEGTTTTSEATTTSQPTTTSEATTTTQGAEVLGESVTNDKPLPSTGFPVGIVLALVGVLLLVGGLVARSAHNREEAAGGATPAG